ncbi:DUF7344 domain-containing protein [Halorussus marinus]|uniref:DUF7344 domain-containing protein n=1 Tax=Halorussus marinus TaxID=2505976 RepID=UPI00106DDD07|nr:hypothetical protein [Halorussus marinus]
MSDTNRPGATDAENGLRTTETADDAALNQAFDVLGDRRRRTVLETLYAADEPARSIEDLAGVLARGPDGSDRERALVGLHHSTLPRLADEGVVDFDPRTDVVRYRGTDPLDELLDVLVDESDCPD